MATGFWNAFGVSLQPLLRLADKGRLTGKIRPLAPLLPVPHKPVEPSSFQEIDELLDKLASKKLQWVQVDTEERAELLTGCLNNVMALAVQLAQAGTLAKGSYEGGIGDEM